MRLEIIECDSHCIGGFGNDPSVLREQFPRFEETTRILRSGLDSAVRKAQEPEQGLHCQALRQDRKHDNSKGQVQYLISVGECVVEAER